ncbi:MAG: acyl-CoA dehydrogenase family protein [Novosphingobium sp.]
MANVSAEVSARQPVPTPRELMDRAESLVGLLRRNAVQAEQLRRLPDETVEALEQAGIFRMLQPVERGGFGSDPLTVSRVLTTIASGCAATTWILMIYSSVAQLAELLGEKALAEIYSGEQPRIAGVFGRSGALLERTAGGFRVKGSGHWPFNSGCRHAGWDLLRLTVEEPDGATWPAFAAVPMAELELCDDWDVMGAAGTGSNSVRCGTLFIPEHRIAKVPSDVRSVLRADASAATNCALPLGMARHALDAFVEVAGASAINHLGYAKMGDAPVVQTALAEAAVDIKLIEGFQQWVLSPYTGGPAIDPGEAGLVSVGSVRCFELARGVIERLFALAPSGQVHRTQSLQRLLRDIHVFQHQHAMTPFINYELYGRRFFAA